MSLRFRLLAVFPTLLAAVLLGHSFAGTGDSEEQAQVCRDARTHESADCVVRKLGATTYSRDKEIGVPDARARARDRC